MYALLNGIGAELTGTSCIFQQTTFFLKKFSTFAF